MPFYKYSKAKRNKLRRLRRRRLARRGRYPLSKSQASAVKKLALNTVNKSRELKCVNFHVDEKQVTLPSSGAVTTNLSNNLMFNYVGVGQQQNQRIGKQVNPRRFVCRGWGKINGLANLSAYQELKVRLVFGYVDNDTLADISASSSIVPYFWNGKSVVAAGDFRDILRNLNYKIISPFYDRTFSIAPAPEFTFDSNTVTSQTRLKDHFTFSINKVMPRSKEITWDSTSSDMWQEKNIVCLSFVRTMNDDTLVTTNVLEYCMEGNFFYHDA